MDIRTGRIYTVEEVAEQQASLLAAFGTVNPWMKPMEVPPTPKQMARNPPTIAPYDTCPCGSGKKFKFCCRVRPGPVGLASLSTLGPPTFACKRDSSDPRRKGV